MLRKCEVYDLKTGLWQLQDMRRIKKGDIFRLWSDTEGYVKYRDCMLYISILNAKKLRIDSGYARVLCVGISKRDFDEAKENYGRYWGGALCRTKHQKI